ncbi:MAG: DUF4910 domain-containing protein [Erysipelotrichaceae bacterium]|nr:DUF4910 domain-containing protein [Erysipelotrichaceae bacterium]
MQNSEIFKNTVSEKRLLNVVKEVSNYHRIQASPMFREAAQHVKGICDRYGLKAKILSYEADPDVWYLQSKMFREWSIKEATLDLDDPRKRLCDYSAEPISVIQKSYPVDMRDTPVDLVLLDRGADEAAYQDTDLNGKWVFIRGKLADYDWIYQKGAIGLVTDFIMETADRKRSDLYHSLTYTSYWHTHLADEPEKRGFVLSPKEGDILAQMCRDKWNSEKKYLQVRPYISSSLYNGHIEVIEAVIEGKDDKTVTLCAHLCHPRSSCNDNASGVSATLEAMHVIDMLVKEGKIEKPQHTIRLILVPEYTGTFAYLSDHNDYEKGLGAMNLDMVGGKQTRFYGPITLTRTPLSTPSLISELSMYSMEQAAKEASSFSGESVSLTNHCVSPYAGGSDHTVYSDPTVNIPCCMLGQWPDLNYHTATDTLDVIDPAVLKFSCLTAVNFAYNLANLTAEDLPYLYEQLDRSMADMKTKLAAEYLRGEISRDMFGSLLYKYRQYFTDCVRTAKDLVADADVTKETEHVQKIFTAWAEQYDLSDSYPENEELTDVWQRTAVGPYQTLSDYRALGFDEAVSRYEENKNEHDYGFEGLVLNYIDGRRTVAELVKEVSLEYRRDMKEDVLLYLELLENLSLIRKTS